MLISVLNWNGLEDTLACLGRLGENPPAFIQVVVLDNGSVDDPRPAISAQFPLVEVIRQPVNLGFTGGHNAVMQLALDRGFDSVLLLNNDCLIDVGSILAMRDMLAGDDRVAAVSPLIYNDDSQRKPQMVAGWIDWRLHRSVQPSQPGISAPEGLPTHVLGTALLLRCAALRKIGLLNAHFFAYYEDNDFSARIASSGYLARYCNSAIALHRHRRISDCSNLSLFLSARNAWLFWRHHTPAAHRAGLTRDLLAQQLSDIAELQADGATIEKQHAVVDGLWHGWRGRSGPPPAARTSPAALRRLATIAPYFLGQLIANPTAAIRGKLARLLERGKATPAP